MSSALDNKVVIDDAAYDALSEKARREFPEFMPERDVAKVDLPPGIVVRNCAFQLERGRRRPFKAGTKNIVFEDSNLDDVQLPSGSTVRGRSSNRRRH